MSATAALAGLTFLVIGESHMATPHYLMNPLHEQLVEQGAKVHSIGVCGASPMKWIKPAPTDCGRAERIDNEPANAVLGNAEGVVLKDVMTQDKTNVILVVIGDTIGSYANPEFPKSWAYQEVTALTRVIKETGAQCYWAGPGWGQGGKRFNKEPELVKRVNDFLAENVAPCTYIDSTKLSQPGDWKTTDGQHYTAKYYKAWAQGITESILANPPKKPQ
ncbi:MAG: SGNH/GDSL hydrolase family protein [Pseudomonadota bacterium]